MSICNSRGCAPRRPIVSSTLQESRGSLGISVEDRAESVLQRIEERLIGPPLLGRIAIDRLPDLLRAGGAHRPLGAVEFQAVRMEVEPAMVEQAADLVLGVVDHPLVE